MTAVEKARELYDQGRLTAAARAESLACDKDGYAVTAGILRDLAARVDYLDFCLSAIADTARWFADNDMRDPQEVDFALCVTILSAAEKALDGLVEPQKSGPDGNLNHADEAAGAIPAPGQNTPRVEAGGYPSQGEVSPGGPRSEPAHLSTPCGHTNVSRLSPLYVDGLPLYKCDDCGARFVYEDDDPSYKGLAPLRRTL